MKILKVKCLAPTRLDNYLMQQYPALNPGRLNKALRENKIKLNGKKQPLSTRVMAGDEIKLFILDEVLDADKRVEGPAWKNARGPAQVVYDCPQILIVNKPAGLSVDGPDDDTLLNRALLYLNQQGEYKENDLYTPALCHRLDTGTSGLVIIAKTPEAEELFLSAIKNREVQKTYLCVTFGRPMPPDATLGGYLLKDADRGIVKIVEDKQPGAKEVAQTVQVVDGSQNIGDRNGAADQLVVVAAQHLLLLFHIRGGGVGDFLKALPPVPECWFTVVMPDYGVSTPEAFAAYDTVGSSIHPDCEAQEKAIRTGDLDAVCAAAGNALEECSGAKDNEAIKALLRAHGAVTALMTGSGAAVFGVFRDEAAARTAAAAARRQWPQVYVAKPDRGGARVIR